MLRVVFVTNALRTLEYSKMFSNIKLKIIILFVSTLAYSVHAQITSRSLFSQSTSANDLSLPVVITQISEANYMEKSKQMLVILFTTTVTLTPLC